MVEEAKQAISDTAQYVAQSMARKDPFGTATAIAVIVLMAWFVYQDHRLKGELITMRLGDQQAAHERMVQLNKFTDVLVSMQDTGAEARELVVRLFRDLEEKEKQHFMDGERMVDDVLAKMDTMEKTMEGKLDLIIQNQQIRSLTKQAQPPGD